MKLISSRYHKHDTSIRLTLYGLVIPDQRAVDWHGSDTFMLAQYLIYINPKALSICVGVFGDGIINVSHYGSPSILCYAILRMNADPTLIEAGGTKTNWIFFNQF